jgi:hypothetical protein
VECQLFLGCAANPDVIPPTGYTDGLVLCRVRTFLKREEVVNILLAPLLPYNTLTLRQITHFQGCRGLNEPLAVYLRVPVSRRVFKVDSTSRHPPSTGKHLWLLLLNNCRIHLKKNIDEAGYRER